MAPAVDNAMRAMTIIIVATGVLIGAGLVRGVSYALTHMTHGVGQLLPDR
jgi:hypothetical protein